MFEITLNSKDWPRMFYDIEAPDGTRITVQDYPCDDADFEAIERALDVARALRDAA